jgi:hypothetical protein
MVDQDRMTCGGEYWGIKTDINGHEADQNENSGHEI